MLACHHHVIVTSSSRHRHDQLQLTCCIVAHAQIPFFPVVKKDLTFIHLGNDSKVDGLINFEKLRMIAKEVRHTCNMASAQYVSPQRVTCHELHAHTRTEHYAYYLRFDLIVICLWLVCRGRI